MSIILTNVVKHCGTAGLLLLHVLVMRLLLGWGGRSWPGSNESRCQSICVHIVIMAYVSINEFSGAHPFGCSRGDS